MWAGCSEVNGTGAGSADMSGAGAGGGEVDGTWAGSGRMRRRGPWGLARHWSLSFHRKDGSGVDESGGS